MKLDVCTGVILVTHGLTCIASLFLQDSCHGSGTACWQPALASSHLSRAKWDEKRLTVLPELLGLFLQYNNYVVVTWQRRRRRE